MQNPPAPRFLAYEKIRRIAEEYARRYDLGKVIPVDIERFVDNILRINIIPFPSLYKSFEINDFISHDFRKIYVDEYLYLNLEPQYRFTLAHELGHMVLHGFRDLLFSRQEKSAGFPTLLILSSAFWLALRYFELRLTFLRIILYDP
jgi:Zn-dependent peptidase ImmA (M78 family)